MSKPERDNERDPELGRFKSAESRARSLANLRSVHTSEEAAQLGSSSGLARKQQSTLREELRRQLAECDAHGRTALERIIATMVKRAIRGDVQAARLLADVEGAFSEDFQPSRIVVVVNTNVERFPEMQKKSPVMQ
jgi:hypothetical protein